MLNISIPIVTTFVWLAVSALVASRLIHILQLEHYHRDGYFKWVLAGGGLEIYSPLKFDRLLHLVSITMMGSLAFSRYEVRLEMLLLSTFGFIWAVRHLYPSGKKTPLKLTPRVWRLTVALLFINAVWLGFMYMYGVHMLVASFVLMAYLQPLFVPLAAIITAPVERQLQNGFKKSAKQKLQGKQVLAITGSYGKTGTKEAVAHLLEGSFPLLKTPGSFNTPMGLCKVINEQMQPHHELFISEMGATRKGDIKELAELANPWLAVITSIGEAHLESFGSKENIAKTKFELADALPDDGVLIYNNDYKEAVAEAAGRVQKTVTYGFNSSADYRPHSFKCSPTGSTFNLSTPDGEVVGVETRLLGKLNILNIAAAFAVGRNLAVPARRLVAAVASLPQMEARLEIIENHGSYLIINDGFNSNILGAIEAVETLNLFAGYKKILVTPGIVDIGDAHHELNFRFGRAAADKCHEVLLINKRRTDPIRQGLRAGGMADGAIRTYATLADARLHLDAVADARSVVLFENDLPDHMESF